MLRNLLIKKFPSLTDKLARNYGLIEESINEQDWVFGASPIQKEILMKDGQWKSFFPQYEIQKGRFFDSMGCVSFSLLNGFEILAKAKFDETWNKSDRYLAKMSGTTRRGNSLRKVADAARHYGIVQEKEWPWDKDMFDWCLFYKEIPNQTIETGRKWLERYTFEYEAVPINKTLIKEALKYSPLWVSGFAWAFSRGKYRSYGRPNHAFLLVGYINGQGWLAFDTYPPYEKLLAWDFQFGTVKQISLQKKQVANKMLAKFLDREYEYIILPLKNGELYKITPEKLIYLSPQFISEHSIEVNNKNTIGISNELFDKLNAEIVIKE